MALGLLSRVTVTVTGVMLATGHLVAISALKVDLKVAISALKAGHWPGQGSAAVTLWPLPGM